MNDRNITGVILLVEDDPNILDANRRILESCGLTVLCAATLGEARKWLKSEKPDIAVLDIMLPDGDGIAFLPELRKERKIPALFLTGKSSDEERIQGLRAGGNDYITKPYKIDEFCARVEAALRWELDKRNDIPDTITKGALTLKINLGAAFLNGADLLLSKKEYALLLVLVQNESKEFFAGELYEMVWGTTMNENPSSLRNAVYRLRSKIEGSGYTVRNVYGEGYCFEKE